MGCFVIFGQLGSRQEDLVVLNSVSALGFPQPQLDEKPAQQQTTCPDLGRRKNKN